MELLLPFQTSLSPEIPQVIYNVDYRNKEELLRRIDEILKLARLDDLFIKLSVEQWLLSRDEAKLGKVRGQDLRYFEQSSLWGFRATILKSLLGCSYRELSCELAQCALYRWFCQMEQIGPIKVAGKSTLQDWAQRLPVEKMQEVIDRLTKEASRPNSEGGQNILGLKNDIQLSSVWLDSTCLKANIHFPVDWVLLNDGVRTLMKRVKLIRQKGLKCRMAQPEGFLKKMNRLAIEMSACRRQKDSKKRQKKVFRNMKKLSKLIKDHALRHRQLLDQEWEKTDWTRAQTEQVLRGIDGVLDQLPKAIKQAHERIIGERQVHNKDKLLSLYDPDVRVIVRRKAGAEVEFGNSLLLVEQSEGLIVDWKLHRESAPSDSKLLLPSLNRIKERFGETVIEAVSTDRGFDSQVNSRALGEKNIYNGVCPKSPKSLAAKMHAAKFVKMQSRRAQTEGRIGILKNDFAGNPMRSKGFVAREIELSWHILTHNLWVLARQERQDQESETPPLEQAA